MTTDPTPTPERAELPPGTPPTYAPQPTIILRARYVVAQFLRAVLEDVVARLIVVAMGLLIGSA